MTYEISGIQPEQLEEAWPAVAPHLYAGASYTDSPVDVETIYSDLQTGRQQLWVVTSGGKLYAAFTTKFITTSEGSYVKGLNVGGDRLQEWLPLAVDTMERWALERGATHTKLSGRRGWERVMEQYGYRPESVVIKKQIRDAKEAH